MATFQFKNPRVQIGFLMVTILLAACSNKTTTGPGKSIAGMYKLYVVEKLDSVNNKWHEDDFGKGGVGYIIYDGLGHMAVQITSKGYKDFIWLTEKQATDEKTLTQHIDSLSCEQLRSAVKEFTSSFVYMADYSINDSLKIITHKRLLSSLPSAWGTEVKRQFSFNGDTLILTFSDGTKILKDGSKRLKWIRHQ